MTYDGTGGTMSLGMIAFVSGGESYSVEYLPVVAEGKAVVETVQRILERLRTPKPTQSSEAAQRADDPVTLIQSLKALHDAGVLTDDEFTAKKTELLKRI